MKKRRSSRSKPYNLRSQNAINKLPAKADGDGEENLQTEPEMTTTMGASTVMGHFIQLPSEIWLMILHQLDTHTLLQCSPLNSTWRIDISKILKKRTTISFSGSHYCRGGSYKAFDRLPELNTLLKINPQHVKYFPCTHFQFTDVDLEHEFIQQFFDLYGPFIKTLQLSRYMITKFERRHWKTLHKFLTKQALNLENLSLDAQMNSRKGVSIFPKSVPKLPHLKSLTQGWRHDEHMGQMMKELIQASENLQSYHIPHELNDFAPLDALYSCGKVHTLKKIFICFTKDNIGVSEKFSTLPTNLVHITFGYQYNDLKNIDLLNRAGNVITQILKQSQDTLQCLEIFGSIGHVPGIQFPVLHHVKTIKTPNCPIIYFGEGLRGPTFPPQSNLNRIFPSVTYLDLYLFGRDDSKEWWDSYFPKMKNPYYFFPLVSKLKVGSLPPNAVESLSKIVPNITTLTVDNVKEFENVCHGIFQYMKQLEHLEFMSVNCSTMWTSNQYPAIEAGVTGFSRETCLELAKTDNILMDQEVNRRREHCSILEMKNLQTFSITRIYYHDKIILSKVPELYAFQKMPSLNVKITFLNSLTDKEQTLIVYS